MMLKSVTPSWYRGACTAICLRGALLSTVPLRRNTSVAADADEPSRRDININRQDLVTEVVGANRTGTCFQTSEVNKGQEHAGKLAMQKRHTKITLAVH